MSRIHRGLLKLAFVVALLFPVVGNSESNAAIGLSFSINEYSLKHLEALSRSPEWRKLLHYQPNITGWKGAVTSEVFWLAPDGRNDPFQELLGTIVALQSDQPIALNSTAESPAQCRFPARYHFLRRQLPAIQWPEVRCPALQRFLHESLPGELTMVYAGGFISSPGSVFGHMFMRIDPSGDGAVLLNKTLNFEAKTAGSWGPQYKFKGLFGGFDGRFSVLPFERQMRRHHRKQMRDIWEWRLNLSDDEKRQLLRHFWELRKVRFNYYFTLENCVTQLLALIEVARPSLQLVGDAGYTVMPWQALDLLEEQGLLLPAKFRPALATELEFHEQRLSVASIRRVAAIAQSPTTENALAGAATADELDVALLLLRFRHRSEQISNADYQAKRMALLKVRAGLAIPSERFDIVPGEKPSRGLGRSRWRIAADYRGKKLRPAAGWRFVLHDLVEPSAAAQLGSSVNALDFLFTVDDSSLQLESLTLLELKSLPARSPFIKPRAWQVSAGAGRSPLESRRGDAILGYVSGGSGFAWGGERYRLFLLGVADVRAGQGLERGWQLSPGVSLGWLSKLAGKRSALFEASLWESVAGDDHQRWRIEATYQEQLSQQWALRLSASTGEEQGVRENRSQLSLLRYF